MLLASTSAGDIAYIALAVFLVMAGAGIFWVCVRLGSVLTNTSSLIAGTERDLLPVVTKVGGSVDRVNHQLDKLDEATDSAVDAVEAVDQAVRAVSFAVKTPVKKSAGAAAGVTHGFATLRKRRRLARGEAEREGGRSPARGRPRGGAAQCTQVASRHAAARPPPPPPAAAASPAPATSPPPGGIFQPDSPI